MANIRDVAKKAGVSVTTVSATVNRSAAVSEETRKRVWEAIDAVGYAPSSVARSLRSGRSRLIGVLTDDIGNPFDAHVVRAAEETAFNAGYAIVISNTYGDDARGSAMLDQLVGHHVAGVIAFPTGREGDYARRIERQDALPIVTIDERMPQLKRDFVGVDNRATVSILTDYLLRLGHTRIAMIAGPVGMWTSDERQAAFVDAMKAAGLDSSLIVQGNYDTDAAYRATQSLMNGPDRPTAIVGANNFRALGALRAAVDLGFRCPEDVSIVGIDDLPWNDLIWPPLTRVVQPVSDIGRIAMEWLLERMVAETQPPPREKILQPMFVRGDSCALVGSRKDVAAI